MYQIKSILKVVKESEHDYNLIQQYQLVVKHTSAYFTIHTFQVV